MWLYSVADKREENMVINRIKAMKPIPYLNLNSKMILSLFNFTDLALPLGRY
jgi:hypothetical protein